MAIITTPHLTIIASRDLELVAKEASSCIQEGWEVCGALGVGEYEFFLTLYKPLQASNSSSPTLPPTQGENVPQRALQGRTALPPKRGRPRKKATTQGTS